MLGLELMLLVAPLRLLPDQLSFCHLHKGETVESGSTQYIDLFIHIYIEREKVCLALELVLLVAPLRFLPSELSFGHLHTKKRGLRAAAPPSALSPSLALSLYIHKYIYI